MMADGQGDERTQGSGPIAIRRGQTGVAFATSQQARGGVVTIILMGVVAVAIIAGLIWLVMRGMLRDERAARQRIERQREAWRAGGCVGPKPGVRDRGLGWEGPWGGDGGPLG